MSRSRIDQVELSAVEVLPSGEGFVLEVTGEDRQVLELHFPVWALHQLMRLLPRIDSALHGAQGGTNAEVPAYPVSDWSFEPAGGDGLVIMRLRNDHDIESGHALDYEAALSLHHDLGAAIAQARASGLPGAATTPHN